MPDKIEDTGPLTLTSLEVENILRLRACKLTMNGDGALIIEGANEAGKSSVLQSLEILLAGMSRTPDEPIHGDEAKGKIVGTFGDLVVTKTFTRGKRPALRITSKRARFSSPQKMLDTLLDHVSLDPLKFMNQDATTQLEVLSKLMDIDEGPLNDRYSEAYEQRRDSNRLVKELEGTLKTLDVDPDAPAEEVSASDLMAELEKIKAHNADGEQLEREYSQLHDAWSVAHDEEAELAEKLSAARCKTRKLETDLEQARLKMTTFEPMEDEEIRQKIATVDETNRKVRNNAEAKTIEARLAAERKSVESFNAQMEEVKTEIEALRAKAHERLPIEDLSLTDDGIYYKGKPLAQAGSSAQLRVSVAVAIALNKDKRIRVLLVDDAEKLDNGNTRLVLTMAREAGFQVFMAGVKGKVGDGDAPSVLIEDGVVANGGE